MNLTKEQHLVLLNLSSILILGMKYGVVGFGLSSFSWSGITIDSIQVKEPAIVKVCIFSAIVISMFCVFKIETPNLIALYRQGYRKCRIFSVYVNAYVADKCGLDKYNDAHKSHKAGFFNRPVTPGQYLKSNGILTNPLTIYLPKSLHWKSVFCGLVNAVLSRIFFVSGSTLLLSGASLRALSG